MGTQKKILVIGDDRDLSNAVKKALSPPEFSVFYAESVSAGFQYLLDYHPHLILYHSNSNIQEKSKVFKTLRASSLWSHIPVIYITDKADMDNFSHELIKNDERVKVTSNDAWEIVSTVRSIVQNDSMAGDGTSDDFELLFQLSPYGIIVMNDVNVVKVNRSFLDAFNWETTESVALKPEDIFEKASLIKIKNWFNCPSKEKKAPFNEQVRIIDKNGWEIEMKFIISSFRKTGQHYQYIGYLFPVSQSREQLASEVCKMLKRENINLTDAHEKKISDIINSVLINENSQQHSLFTKREIEVLRLSMEGCSIKIIADKLSISSRTVEKYRTKLMEKSGSKNIAEVIVFALKNELIRI